MENAAVDDNILSRIGRTPLVRLKRLPAAGSADVLCKCEQFNPGGSVKDRTALAMVEAGWPALGSEPEYGGQGLPRVVNLAYSEMSSSANMAFSMYPGLTHGAYSAILAGGTDAQKDLYLPKLATGQWGGAMNLTEPQCGTDLGLLRTKAVPQADGTYRITGQKIWISGGEHDLAENIVHLVLARPEGAGPGTKGLSLFVVPKFHVDLATGELGARNGVRATHLEHRASSSPGKHEGEPSFALCDRLDRTRDNSQRQLPTDHDYAVPTREYQTDQSSLKTAPTAARSVFGERQRQLQKQPHRSRGVDAVTPYQANSLIEIDCASRPPQNCNNSALVTTLTVEQTLENRKSVELGGLVTAPVIFLACKITC